MNHSKIAGALFRAFWANIRLRFEWAGYCVYCYDFANQQMCTENHDSSSIGDGLARLGVWLKACLRDDRPEKSKKPLTTDGRNLIDELHNENMKLCGVEFLKWINDVSQELDVEIPESDYFPSWYSCFLDGHSPETAASMARKVHSLRCSAL